MDSGLTLNRRGHLFLDDAGTGGDVRVGQTVARAIALGGRESRLGEKSAAARSDAHATPKSMQLSWPPPNMSSFTGLAEGRG